ncbi:UNVERIFIED_CONTAM: putative Ig domain-containing protein, partial [Bacteroidetes bacterium 56_B9]
MTIYATYAVAPKFTSTSLPGAGLNQPYDQALPVTGGGTYYSYVVDYDNDGNPLPGLPAGLTLSSTGHLTGT